MHLEVIAAGVLYRNPHPDLQAIHACFARILPLNDTEMLCVYRRGSAFASVDGRIAQLRSLDGGKTWQQEGLVWDGTQDELPYCYRGPALTMLPDGTLLLVASRWDRSDPTLPLYNPVTEGYLPCEVVLFRSHDRGHTWTPPAVVPLPEGMVANSSGGVHVLDEGRLLLPLESWKAYDDPRPARQQALALFSDDNGATWDNLTVIADGAGDGRYYWDQNLTHLGGGRLLAMFWTHDPDRGQDLPVHRSLSEDGGRTWSPPEPTNIQGQVTCPASLGEGRVAAVYNLRYGDRPGIMAALSRDEGHTWDLANQVPVWDALGQTNVGTATGEAELSRHVTIAFGKPELQVLPDGDLLASFWCTTDCVTHIRWCRLRVVGC